MLLTVEMCLPDSLRLENVCHKMTVLITDCIIIFSGILYNHGNSTAETKVCASD